MGMYGGQLTGLRARREDDLREAQFREKQRQARGSEQMRERQFGLQTRQYEEGAKRAEAQLGLERQAGARAERSGLMAERKMMDEQKATKYSRTYEAALMGDMDTALQTFNQGLDPRKHATHIMVDENKNLVIGRRGDTATVEYEKLRRYLPKDPIEYAAAQKSQKKPTANELDWEAELALRDAAEQYEFKRDKVTKDILPEQARVFRTGKKTGLSTPEVAMHMGLKPILPPEIQTKLTDIDKQVAGLRTGWAWTPSGRIEERANMVLKRQALFAQKYQILDQAVATDPAVQAANQQLVQQFSAFDTNQDQQINELDADYQGAQQLVDRMKSNPALRAALIQAHGAAAIGQAEALVKAVQQKAKLTAERRVGLGKAFGGQQGK